jgi:hypothetical protein
MTRNVTFAPLINKAVTDFLPLQDDGESRSFRNGASRVSPLSLQLVSKAACLGGVSPNMLQLGKENLDAWKVLMGLFGQSSNGV